MSRETRERSVEQSLQDFIRAALTDRDFPMAQIELRDAFEQREFEGPIDKDYVALGFNFDGGGQPVECGSNLRQYRHTIEVFVFAVNAGRGSTIAYAIRDALESAERVDLKDVYAAGKPVIGVVLIDPVSVERQPIPDPEPWEEFVWLLRVPVADEYDPAVA